MDKKLIIARIEQLMIEGATNQRVEYGGRTLSVTAIPNDGYRFVEWSDGIKTDTRSDRNITSNFTVTAKFEKMFYSVQYLTDGNGTITH